MAEVKIQVPDGYELKQVSAGKWELVKVKKNQDSLFEILKNHHYGTLSIVGRDWNFYYNSEEQIVRLIALSKLMVVADHLNDGWKPDWSDCKYNKYFIAQEQDGILRVFSTKENCGGLVYFKSDELAIKAIEICGEEMIRDIFDM